MRPFAAILALAIPLSASAVPLEFSHQGRIVDSAGAPLTGSHTLEVTLYDEPAGGSILWSEVRSVVFDAGYYDFVLGSDASNPIDAEDFVDEAIYMGLRVDGGTELPDRIVLRSVPFAVRALTATNVSGGVVNATSLQIDGNEVVSADGTVSWSALVDVPEDISNPSDTLDELLCSVDEVVAWSGTEWTCWKGYTNASNLAEGSVPLSQLPIGTDADTIASGNHVHDASAITTGQLENDRLPTDIAVGGTLQVTGDVTAASGLDVTGELTGTSATLSGDLSAASATLAGDLTASSAAFSGDLSSNSISVTGELAAASATLTGELAADSVVVGGELSADTAIVTGEIAATAGFIDTNLGVGITEPNSRVHIDGAVQVGEDNSTCDGDKAGAIRFQDGEFQGCDGSDWLALTLQPDTFRSCQDARSAGATDSGVYTLDVDDAGPNPPFEAYCDMTTNGGGWTLAYRLSNSDSTTSWHNMSSATNNTTLNAEAHTNTSVDYRNPAYWLIQGDELLVKSGDGALVDGSCGSTNSLFGMFRGSRRDCSSLTFHRNNAPSFGNASVVGLGIWVNEPNCSYPGNNSGDDCTLLGVNYNTSNSDLGSCWNTSYPIAMGCAQSNDTNSPSNRDIGYASNSVFLEVWIR